MTLQECTLQPPLKWGHSIKGLKYRCRIHKGQLIPDVKKRHLFAYRF